jgi:hypothetical protein
MDRKAKKKQRGRGEGPKKNRPDLSQRGMIEQFASEIQLNQERPLTFRTDLFHPPDRGLLFGPKKGKIFIRSLYAKAVPRRRKIVQPNSRGSGSATSFFAL